MLMNINRNGIENESDICDAALICKHYHNIYYKI